MDESRRQLSRMLLGLMMLIALLPTPTSAVDIGLSDLLEPSVEERSKTVMYESYVRGVRDATWIELFRLMRMQASFLNSDQLRFVEETTKECIDNTTPESLLLKAKVAAEEGKRDRLSDYIFSVVLLDCASYLQETLADSGATKKASANASRGENSIVTGQIVLAVVPKDDIDAGTRITASNMAERPFSQDDLPVGYVPPRDFVSIHNGTVNRAFASGEALVYADISGVSDSNENQCARP